MDSNSGGLIDDEQSVVLEENFQLNRVGFWGCDGRRLPLEWNEDLYAISMLNECVGPNSLAVYADCVFPEEL